MRIRLRHILITLLVGVGLTLGVTTLLATSSPTGRTAGDGVLCVVPSGGPSGPFPACSQVFTSVQEAIDSAVAGQEVRVTSGVYTDVHTRDGVAQIAYISKSISIHGGYAPPFEAPPDPLAQPTTLDAQGQGRVVYITGDISATLTGLRITGGDATGLGTSVDSGSGGGVYAISATVTISGSMIYSNTASSDRDGRGGGLAFSQGHITLTGNTIQRNTASWSWFGVGGGLLLGDSDFHVADNRVLSNTAVVTNVFNGYGGGVAIAGSSGRLMDNLIAGNEAIATGGTAFGGGIFLGTSGSGRDDVVTMRNNTLRNNIAVRGEGKGIVSTVGYGGGIVIWNNNSAASLDARMLDNTLENNIASVAGMGFGGGLSVLGEQGTVTLTVINNLIVSNTATVFDEGFGGGILTLGAKADFAGNRIISNSAAISGRVAPGGGMYFYQSQVEQRGDIVRGNAASTGSGIVFDESRGRASNLVVTDNRADSEGAGLSFGRSDVALLHPTLARNRGDSGIYFYRDNEVSISNAILVSHSVGIHVADGNTVTVDGVLWYNTPIALSKGPAAAVTITHQVIGDPLFAADGYHLTAGSAAIGRGVPTSLQVDIDNEVRPLAPALGADEYWADKAYLPLILRE